MNMKDFWVEMAISVILAVLKQTVKSPEKKAELKKSMLKVRNNIDVVYADDEDFA